MIAVTVACVLALLAALHVYWAIGGTWGMAGAIPTANGRPAFTPSPAATLVVALGLAAAAVAALLQGGVLRLGIPQRLVLWGNVALAVIFLARAIGDFRLVGFFKRQRGTEFAVRDTWVYSPLCLFLALGFVLVALR